MGKIKALNEGKIKALGIEAEAEKILNALCDQTDDISKAFKKLDKALDENRNNSYLTKLPKLVKALTSISKRKTLNTTLNLSDCDFWTPNKERVVFGLNNNGLGFERWGSQLKSLCECDRYNEVGDEDFSVLMSVFNNEELCIEIADEILARNRKNFLRLVAFFRKIPKTQGINKDREIILNENLKVLFNMNFNFLEIRINDFKVDIDIINIIRSGVYINNTNNPNDLTICDFMCMEKIIDNHKEIADAIYTNETNLKEMIKLNKNTNNFVFDMIKPIEALEKL